MSKNEDILKARQLMQQTLSHGASSPKLSKMKEVLLEHFSKYNFVFQVLSLTTVNYQGVGIFLLAAYNGVMKGNICILKDVCQ